VFFAVGISMNNIFKHLIGILGGTQPDRRINQNQPVQGINLIWQDISSLQRELLAFYPAPGQNRSLQQYRDHFDAVVLAFIDLDVPDRFSQRITTALHRGNEYLKLLTPEDIHMFERDQRTKNEVLSVLSGVARQLQAVLVDLRKAIDMQ
jgi:hypothetical protein